MLRHSRLLSTPIVSFRFPFRIRMPFAHGADLSSAADDPTRTLIRQVLSAVAQFDKSMTVLKLRAARERLRRKGRRVEGRKPYSVRPDERTSSTKCGN